MSLYRDCAGDAKAARREPAKQVWRLVAVGFQPMASVAGHAIDRMAVAPDGSQLATALGSGSLLLWNLSSGPRLWSARVPDRVYDQTWSPDGRWLATTCKNGSVDVCDG